MITTTQQQATFPMYSLEVIALSSEQAIRVLEFQQVCNQKHPQENWETPSYEDINKLRKQSNSYYNAIVFPYAQFSLMAQVFMAGMNIRVIDGICIDRIEFTDRQSIQDISGDLFDRYTWTIHLDKKLYVIIGDKETNFLMALRPGPAPRAPKVSRSRRTVSITATDDTTTLITADVSELEAS